MTKKNLSSNVQKNSPLGVNGKKTRNPSRSFAKFDHYGSDLSESLRDTCDALNSLPGISSSGGRYGPNKVSFAAFRVRANNTVGLSFLTRCMDPRYFKFGDRLRIDLRIADIPPTEITYSLETVGRHWAAQGVDFKGPDACEILDALVENMTSYLNQEWITSHYDLSTFTLASPA